MGKKLTIKEVKDYCLSIGSEFRSNIYENNNTKYDFKCITCNNTINRSLSKIKSGSNRCNDCIGKTIWNIEKAKKFSLEKGCKMLSETFTSVNDKYKFECSECGEPFEMNFQKFKNRNKIICNKCNNRIYWDVEKIKEYCNNIGIKFLDDFYSMEKGFKHRFTCKTCGKEILKNFQDIKTGSINCYDCSIKIRAEKRNLDIDYVKNYCLQNKSEFLSTTYKNNMTKYPFKCTECGNSFETTFNRFKDGKRRCGKCSNRTSKCELIINNFLKNNKINYIPEYSFKDCVNKSKLRMDFFLPDYNLVIEYNGELHSENFRLNSNVLKNFGGLKGLLLQTKRDIIKKRYCRDKGIKFLEIWYYEKHQINKILKYALGI